MTRPTTDEGADLDVVLDALTTTPQHQRPALEDTIVSACLPRARRLARRYRRRGLDDEDLEQIASVALLLAVRRYDPGRGSFWPFATVTITGELRRAFRDQAWLVRPTRSVQELRLRVAKRQDELEQRSHRPPTAAELAADLDVDVSDVVEAVGVSSCFRPGSLDAPVPGTDLPLTEGLGAVDERFEHLERWLSVATGLRGLSDRDRRTLRLRFVDDLSQGAVGRRIGVSQMQISRDLARILQLLRDAVEAA